MQLAKGDSAKLSSLTFQDENAQGPDFWIYNNLDAEVAKNNQLIVRLAQEHFVAVRQVEMKWVDLSQFQFDYDLNWAAMFVNADDTVYARYGNQSAADADAYNSIASVEKTMRRVLALHEDYSNNKNGLAGKLGKPKPYKTALEMPGMKHRAKLSRSTARNNCVQCHNIHDAVHEQLYRDQKFSHDALWRYPLPENMGLTIDPDDGLAIAGVKSGSTAFKSGLRAGDTLARANGQLLTSIADLQWVLHKLPNTDTKVTLQAKRGDESIVKKIAINAGWKKTDISWRGSLWSLKPVLATWCAQMKKENVKKLQLGEGVNALEVPWINTGRVEGRVAKRAGLKKGDIIIGMENKPLRLTSQQFNMHVKLNYEMAKSCR